MFAVAAIAYKIEKIDLIALQRKSLKIKKKYSAYNLSSKDSRRLVCIEVLIQSPAGNLYTSEGGTAETSQAAQPRLLTEGT
jgi:hypothetical protein